MSVWFISDLHFYHSNILVYNPNRKYNSVEHMNEGLILNWNSKISPEDIVYCLGDFSFAARPVELYSHRLNGVKKLIPGNHDPVHPYNKMQKKKVKQGSPDYWKDFYEANGWEVLPLIHELEVAGIGTVLLSHMPYNCTQEKFKEYIPKDKGKWLLHGHTHSLEKTNGKMIHVGVDAWDCFPVSLEEVKALMS